MSPKQHSKKARFANRSKHARWLKSMRRRAWRNGRLAIEAGNVCLPRASDQLEEPWFYGAAPGGGKAYFALSRDPKLTARGVKALADYFDRQAFQALINPPPAR